MAELTLGQAIVELWSVCCFNIKVKQNQCFIDVFCGNLCFNSHLPKINQSFLMSATFNEEVQALKELLLHNPVTSFSCSTS